MKEIEQYLIDQGMDELLANAWAKFAYATIAALREAERMLCEREQWEAFCKLDGALGRQRSKGRGKAKLSFKLPLEEAITQALYENLWTIKTRSKPGSPLRELSIEFNSETRMPSRTKVGKKARKTDLWARSSQFENAWEMVFESKVLLEPSDIQKHYLGKQGLGCFTGPDEPYTQGPLGGLIAYVVQGDHTSWLKEIREKMDRPIALARSHHSLAIPPVGELLISEVGRDAAKIERPISLIHLIMRFFAVPPFPEGAASSA